MVRGALCVAFGALLLAAPAADTHAQVVHGRVLQAGTRVPLQDVAVSVRNLDGRSMATAVTDTAGMFRIHSPRTGNYEISAERIGYTKVTSPLTLNVGEQVEVELKMDVTAVALDPLQVKAREPYDLGMLAGFYERLKRHERSGLGTIITRDEIAERNALDTSDLLRIAPRITVVSDRASGRGSYVVMRSAIQECHPRVYLNGTLANRYDRAFVDEIIKPGELEGVEIYQGLTELPGIYHDDSGCGVILLWTNRGDGEGARPFNWKRVVGALGLATLVAFLAAR